jgi:hypothetical protein
MEMSLRLAEQAAPFTSSSLHLIMAKPSSFQDGNASLPVNGFRFELLLSDPVVQKLRRHQRPEESCTDVIRRAIDALPDRPAPRAVRFIP